MGNKLRRGKLVAVVADDDELNYVVDFRMVQGLVARDYHLSSSDLTTDLSNSRT